MAKEATLLRGVAVCDFDELTHDALHNQILKATLSALSLCEEVQSETRQELKLLARRFHDVSDIRLSGNCFRHIVLSRNNREYIFLLELCEFVFLSLMPDERGVGARFQSVLDDELRMSAIF